MAELRQAGGYARRLRSYLKRPLDAGMERGLERGLERRETSFVDVLRRGVFERPSSPYLKLLEWAGVEYEEVAETVADAGIEVTLERLYDAGVFLSWDEFKGKVPVIRPGLELHVRAGDFDNPLGTSDYEARTGGSSGASRRILVDLDLLEHESVYHGLALAAADADDRPTGIWAPVPPGVVAMKTALIQARLGRPVERWFSHTDLRRADLRTGLFTRGTLRAIAGLGGRPTRPEHTPLGDARRVAEWLADRRAQGSAAILFTTASGGVRACLAALEADLEIEGSLFVLGGEPYTPAKAATIAATGSTALSHYAMAEAGAIGIACQAADAVDDVHLLGDKIATIQRRHPVIGNGVSVSALVHTTLLPASPKLMLNVDSGDHAVRGTRECGCGALPGSFRDHLHTIRSHEKLNSEGMTFLGTDLIALLEEELPARFGGGPTDYQLVEREERGVPHVHLLIREAVGELDPDQVSRSALAFLRDRGRPEELMAEVWSQGRTLRVVRGDPHVTPGSKVPPLKTLGE